MCWLMVRWARISVVLLVVLAISVGHAAEKAPDFSLRGIDGKSYSLSQFSGEVVLLSFWATWCAPCLSEMPHLQSLHETYGSQGFTVLSINTDDVRSSSQVKPVVRSKGVDFPVLLDGESSVVTMYNPAKTLPYAVLIDQNLQIAKIHSGYTPGDEVVLEEEIKGLLGLSSGTENPSTDAPSSPQR